ncbi:MAG: hypothetical protein U0736_15400 [Gemmataceae bacterium]
MPPLQLAVGQLGPAGRQGAIAGHVIEYALSDQRAVVQRAGATDLSDVGYPIAEIEPDARSISKPATAAAARSTARR